jgi:esterase FrsA
MSATGTATADVEKLRQNLRDRITAHKAPFHVIDVPLAQAAIDQLQSSEPEHWAAVWSAPGAAFAEKAKTLEAGGDTGGARENYLLAYGFYHVARFPSPIHPAKDAAYRKSIEMFRAAGRYFSPPLEVIEVPFTGRHEGEGKTVTFYVRRKPSAAKQPVLIRCGGVDTWKEERNDYNDLCIAAGFAQINIDGPGVGEAPLPGSLDGERMYLPMLDWIRTQPDLDADRVLFVGMSYGGYWSTKIAHCYHDRFAGVVNWGGGVDKFFSREWSLSSLSASSYLMDLGPARARTVGKKTYEEYIEEVDGFSLLKQGILDGPHAPMLVLNGRHDEQVPFDDMVLLLEHGAPKAARFFPGGHMGYGPNTFPTVLAWLKKQAGIA